MDYVATECQQPHDSDNKLNEQKSLAPVLSEATASPMPSTATVRRCDICGHPSKGHPKPRGKNCQQISLSNAQSKEDKHRERLKTEIAKAKNRERQKTEEAKAKRRERIKALKEKTEDKTYTCIKEQITDEIKTEIDDEAFYPYVSLDNNTVDVIKDEKDTSIVEQEADSFQFMQTDLQFVKCETENPINEVCTKTPQAAFVKETKSIGEKSSQIEKILSSYKNIMPKSLDLQANLVVYPNHDNNFAKCGKCSSSFDNDKKLRRHINSVHNQNEFICEIDDCGKSFNVRGSLKRHEVDVHGGIKITCPYCNLKCAKTNYKRHIKKYCKNNSNISVIEHFVCNLDNNTVDVIKDEIENDAFQFIQTDLDFVKCKTEDHINEVQAIAPQIDFVKQTKSIAKKSSQVSQLENIMPMIKPKTVEANALFNTKRDNSFLNCDKCSSSFDNDKKLRRHINSVHKCKSEEFICEIDDCGKSFKVRGSLKRHEADVHGGIKITCQYCNLKIAKTNYKRHKSQYCKKNSSSVIEHFICNHCPKVLSSQTSLKRHLMAAHTLERPYSCEYCSKSFLEKQVLTKHIRTHTGEKPFVCIQCSKAFAEEKTLVSHIRTHTGEKPYLCNQCPKAFSEQSHLKRHLKTHTGEKPYTCEECPKTFSQSSNLTIHMRTHSGEKPFPCYQCPKRFSHKVSLNSHVMTHSI